MEVLLLGDLALGRFLVIREVEQVLQRLGEEPAVVVLPLHDQAVPLHEGPRRRGRVAVARVAEALLIGGEAQHSLERESRPPGLPLRRHEEEIPARLQHPDHLGEEGLVVLDVLQEIDRRDEVEGPAPKRDLPLPDLEHPVADQLARGAGVVPLEVAAHPGAAALPEKVRGEPGPAADLQAEPTLHPREVAEERVDGELLLERPTVQLQLPGLSQV